jgi:hypothetical protein
VPELGVRMALGADGGRILRLVVSGVLGQVLAGVAVGVALACSRRGARQPAVPGRPDRSRHVRHRAAAC